MASLNVEAIVPASAGLDTESAPDRVSTGTAPEHRNFLVHRDGRMPLRGPLVDHTALDLGTNELVTGAWVFNDKLLVGTADADATAVREPHTAPYRKAAAAVDLAEPETTMKLVDLVAETVTDVVGTQDTVIAGRGVRIGGKVYGFAYSSGTDVNENGGFQHRRALLGWDGSTSAPVAVTGAPDGGQDVITHYNRLFVLGGRDVAGGGTTIEPNTLFYSDFGGPDGNIADDWEDDVSGLSNKIVVGADDPNDYGVGLAVVGQSLVIFKRRSIYVLTGYDDSTFTLRPFSHGVGCLDARSIVQGEDGCFFLSAEGYMYFDGAQMYPVSGNVQSELISLAESTVGDNGSDGARCVAERLPNNYLMISLVSQSFVDGSVGESNCYLFHIPSGRWTRFTSDALANPVPLWVERTNNYTTILDGSRVVKADYLTLPEAAPETARGFDTVATASARIPALWYSELTRLSTPLHMAQLHRLLIDYTFVVDGVSDGAVNGWYVSLINADGTQLLDEYQLPNMGENSAYLYRRRNVVDVYSEVTDCQLRVEWRADAPETFPALIDASIYGAYLEFSPSRQRRSS